jgi:hypothetical protein
VLVHPCHCTCALHMQHMLLHRHHLHHPQQG